MLEVINRGRAKVCGVKPGARGEVDETNPSVRAALLGGVLVDAASVRASLLAEAGGYEALLSENAALKAKLAELEAALAAKAAPAPSPRVPKGAKVEG